jgi:phosphatidylglycerol:prolipoprotein diacylglycerol transferase
MLHWMDIITPGLILAQAIGRWGNLINQELYGRPTDLPWGIYIDPAHRLSGFEMYERFHPTFFYESMWNLATCVLLVYLTKRYRDRWAPGIVAALYFMSYSIIRFLLEFIRLDSATVGKVPIAQIVAVLIVLASAGFIAWRSKTYKKPVGQGVDLAAGADVEAEGATTEMD